MIARRHPLRSIITDAPFLLLVASFAAVGAVSHKLFGVPFTIRWAAGAQFMGFFSFLYLGVAAFVLLSHLVVAQGRSLLQWRTWKDCAIHLIRPGHLLGTVAVLAAATVLMQVFMAYKQAIPVVVPFSWDATFMEIDRWLHLGRHPFELGHALLAHPRVTKAIDLVYFFWIHVMWFTLIWQAWHGSDRRLRSRYLLSFAACWILLGTVAATALSSAGPIFYGRVVAGPNPFEPLVAHLESVGEIFPLRVLTIRDFLWTSYTNPEDAMFGGISAMPSLHIAIVTLQVLLGFSVNRVLGWAYALFAVAIFIGSVHLGWHYAIDGYVSAVAVVGIWWMSGRIVTWWEATGCGSFAGSSPDGVSRNR